MNLRPILIVWLTALLTSGARPVLGQTDRTLPKPALDRPSPGPGASVLAQPPREVIILNNASEMGELLRRLGQPDLVIKKPAGEEPGRTAPPPAAGQAEPRGSVVNSVKLRGRVQEDMAELSVEMEIELLVSGPVWVPVRLDGQVLTAAREESRELALRSGEGGRWEVRIEGSRAHQIRIELKAPVRARTERKQLELMIPESASTSLELDSPHQVFDVDLGAGETVGQSPLPGAKGTHLSAHVSPRSRLVLSWSDEANSTTRLMPLLTAQGEIAIDVDPQGITTRSSWAIRCVRGTARLLAIKLDEEDLVPKIQLDGQFALSSIEQNVLSIPLGEPMRPGSTRLLSMETKRAILPGARRTVVFSGFPLVHASEQVGAIGVTQSPNLWVNAKPAQGLRRIDPRDLPGDLKARPGTTLAFQFLEQPFKLELGLEESPPLFRADTNVDLRLDSELTQNQTSFEIQRVRGRLFELEVGVPPGLQLVSVGPPELVESATLANEGAGSAVAPLGGQHLLLKVRLTPLGRDQRSFTLELKGTQRIRPAGDIRLALFTIRGSASAGATYRINVDREVTCEAPDEATRIDGVDMPIFSVQKVDEKTVSSSAALAPALQLRSSRNPESLGVRLTRHKLMLNHDTNLAAQVTREWIDVRQETRIQVRYGSVSSLTVQVPTAATELFEVQTNGTVKRQDLGQIEGGDRRVRLTFDPPIVDRSSLLFLYRLPMAEKPDAKATLEGRVSWIRIEEGTSGETMLQLGSESGIDLGPNDPDWVAAPDEEPGKEDGPFTRRYKLGEGGRARRGFQVAAKLLERASMPALVAPRAYFRTTAGFDDEIRTQASFWIETHPAHVSIQLPEHARWIRARIDGRTADEVEFDPARARYRLILPSDAQSKPILLEVEYQLSRTQSGRVWQPPRLLDGGVVLQALWAMQIPWNMAVVGAPGGWSDENIWYWDFYVWKRRPARSLSRLAGWVSGSSLSAGGEESGDGSDDSHTYLFGRSGDPVAMEVWIAPRAWIVAVCSGSVLALGFLLMFYRPRYPLIWGTAAVLALVGSAFTHPSVSWLAIQSAVIGVILTLLGFLIQGMIHRRTGGLPTARMAGSPSGQLATRLPAPASQQGVGSDDSTAIRARTPSTLDHVVSAGTASAEPEPARGSSLERFD